MQILLGLTHVRPLLDELRGHAHRQIGRQREVLEAERFSAGSSDGSRPSSAVRASRVCPSCFCSGGSVCAGLRLRGLLGENVQIARGAEQRAGVCTVSVN